MENNWLDELLMHWIQLGAKIIIIYFVLHDAWIKFDCKIKQRNYDKNKPNIKIKILINK